MKIHPKAYEHTDGLIAHARIYRMEPGRGDRIRLYDRHSGELVYTLRTESGIVEWYENGRRQRELIGKWNMERAVRLLSIENRGAKA